MSLAVAILSYDYVCDETVKEKKINRHSMNRSQRKTPCKPMRRNVADHPM